MNKITTTFYNKGDMILKISTRIKGMNNEPCYNKYKVMNGYITLTYNPSSSITIESRDKRDLIHLPIEDFYTLADYIKSVYKGLLCQDMFHIDDQNKLIPNMKLVKEYAKTIVAYDKVMIIRPDVISYNNTEYEGVSFIINNSSIIRMRHFDVKKLYKLMNKTDINNYILNLSSIALHLEERDIPAKNLSSNEYAIFKGNNNNTNKNILQYNKPRKGLFQ